jgi:hypothetical protein
MGIVDRLRRLEQGSRSCSVCGYPSITYDARYVDSEEALQAAYEEGPEHCTVCGRKLVFPIFFTDDRVDTLPVMVCRMKPKEGYADGA